MDAATVGSISAVILALIALGKTLYTDSTGAIQKDRAELSKLFQETRKQLEKARDELESARDALSKERLESVKKDTRILQLVSIETELTLKVHNLETEVKRLTGELDKWKQHAADNRETDKQDIKEQIKSELNQQ